MKEKNKAELLEEITRLRKRVAVQTKHDAARKHAESALREANMRLSTVLTELKKHQQQLIQQARLNALGQMTSGIAHDFNNALMPIQGFTEFLLNHPATLDRREEALAIIRDVNTAAKHASDIVRRLSSFYRHSDESEHVLADIAELLTSVISLTRPKWKEEMASRGIAITFDTSFQKGPLLSCNDTQMKEAFTNLVLNAVDAMPRGGTISLSTRFDDKWATIRVADNGIGMLPEIRQRCFEPFFSTKGRGGMGIGLAMVYGIIRGHDGQISVESEEGEGSTFTILLPVEAPIPHRRKPAPQPLVDVPPLQILIVDDEPWSRSLMTRHLSHRNHKVVSTQDGETALAKFQEHKFDLVITDRAMPDMSGDSVAVAMKQICPDVPIIMVTGFGEIMKATGETPKGVDDILSKPVTRTELDHSIARVMSNVKKH